MSIPDNFDIWEAHEIRMEMRLARRPKCKVCDQHIQEETAIKINGEYICEVCISDHREEIDDEDFL